MGKKKERVRRERKREVRKKEGGETMRLSEIFIKE